jgi:hypothetical protein
MKLVLDAGAFIAFERGDAAVAHRLSAARRENVGLVTTAPVVAQVWHSARQVILGRLLVATEIDAPNEATARRAGELLAKAKTRDVVDALVIGLARDGDLIVTSDPDDLRKLLVAARVNAALIAV